jgi:hypothetical protein
MEAIKVILIQGWIISNLFVIHYNFLMKLTPLYCSEWSTYSQRIKQIVHNVQKLEKSGVR